MNTSVRQYRHAAQQAVDFQLKFQEPDGGFVWEGFPKDAFHKQAYSWGVAGRLAEANRLLDWIRRERLLSDGEIMDYHSDIYKYSWMVQGAHRLGRFDVSFPVFQAASRYQAACGGFPVRPRTNGVCRALSTCWLGVTALYVGDLQLAQRAFRWTESVCEQQRDPTRFYFQTTSTGELVTRDSQAASALYVNNRQPQQCYWEIGLPLQLACRLYMATGAKSYLDSARRLFDRHCQCGADAFASTSSGKSALGAALLYAIRGDEAPRQKAVEFCNFLLETQLPEGSWHHDAWPDEVLYYLDAAAEFSVWLFEIAALLSLR